MKLISLKCPNCNSTMQTNDSKKGLIFSDFIQRFKPNVYLQKNYI